MKAGWNPRYIKHCLLCRRWLGRSSKLASLVVLAGALLLTFKESNASVPDDSAAAGIKVLRESAEMDSIENPAVESMKAFLKRHRVRESSRERMAESIVASARKHGLDPKLIASITIVESRGNPIAISGASAVGIMQIHLPTWGAIADRENVNLMKIEDNIDFGSRILKTYVRQYGLWEGVKRYNGFFRGNEASEQAATEYVAKVQHFYGVPPVETAALVPAVR
jgi:soluble lytic murein transglycosylase-like protein